MIIILSSFALADEGFNINPTNADVIRQNSHINFNFHVHNKSTGHPIVNNINCYFYLYNASGDRLIHLQDSTPQLFDYTFSIHKNNFSNIGQYTYITQCNNSAHGGYYAGEFEVTKEGIDEDAATGYATIGIILLMMFTTFFIVYLAVNINMVMVQVPLSVLSVYFLAFDFFYAARALEILGSYHVNLINTLFTLYNVFLIIGRFCLVGATIFIFYYIWMNIYKNKQRKRGFEGDMYGKY